jgi:hypothetical protein
MQSHQREFKDPITDSRFCLDLIESKEGSSLAFGVNHHPGKRDHCSGVHVGRTITLILRKPGQENKESN